jgi:beta-lactamase class D
MNNQYPPFLKTERLILRAWRAETLESYARMNADLRVSCNLKNWIGAVLLFFGFFMSASCFAGITRENASNRSLVVKYLQSNRLYQEGDVTCRVSPCSTFKIALSLMGYDSGILQSETSPEWSSNDGNQMIGKCWKSSFTPKTWIQHSCVWYSQAITQLLGIERFKNYIESFQYGNRDISGDLENLNGLTHCWLSSSLTISPQEQVDFLEKLINRQIPCSKHAHEMTKHILFFEDLAGGWRLYGKAGTGLHQRDGSRDEDYQIGWFVGWVENQDQTILLALLIQDQSEANTLAGNRATEEAKQFLNSLE